MMGKSIGDIKSAYEKAGISKDRVVYITGNFGTLQDPKERDKYKFLNMHFSIIRDLIGCGGTIVVPTHSWSVCNSDKSFDIEKTPSETGVFTEFIRKLPGSFRQFHPFASVTAYGPDGSKFCENNTRHAYGPMSPFARMIEADALHVSIGMPVNNTIALVHHAEFMMGVPYRYVKEFIQPCVVDGKLEYLEFYLSVLRKDIDIVRDRNKKILRHFCETNTIKKSNIERSMVQSLNFKNFYDSTVDLLSKDIYAWLSHPPRNRSEYQQ